MQPISLNQVQNFSILSFIWKYKLLFLFIFFTLPLVTSSIITAFQTSNPTYPFILLGTAIINSDNLVYQDVQALKVEPSKVLGVNPEIGIYRHLIYYLHIILFIWQLLSKIFFIIIPFSFVYFTLNLVNNSTKLKNLILSGIIGISFIFVVNLLMTIVELANGSVSLVLQGNEFNQIFQVIFLTIPFHGLISLINYIVYIFI